MTSFIDRLRAAKTAFLSPQPTAKMASIDPRYCGLVDATLSGWYQQETNELAPGFTINRDDVLIDIGCGVGDTSGFYVPRCDDVTLIDIEHRTLHTALERNSSLSQGQLRAISAIAGQLPLSGDIATKIVMMEVLEHTSNPLEVLKDVHRVCKPGGQILITVPSAGSEASQQQWAPDAYFSSPNHIQTFDQATLSALCEEAGLVVIKEMQWGFYWAIGLLLHWISQKETGAELSGAALDTVAPPYGPLMYQWSQLWHDILRNPETRSLALTLNNAYPKSIGIIVQKPLLSK